MKIIRLYLASLALLATFTSAAKVIEYKEDIYCMQAPKNIVDTVEKVANLFGYTGDYEVIAPKTPAVDINPANAFIGYAVNPSTKNNFIMINTGWFAAIPEDQQIFLLGRVFVDLKRGGTPWYIKYMSYIYMLFSLLFMVLVTLLLFRFLLYKKKLWVSIIVASIVSFSLEIFVFDSIHNKFSSYMLLQHNLRIDKEVYETVGSKEAAINALETVHNDIQKELDKGQNFWLSHRKTYQERANILKQS